MVTDLVLVGGGNMGTALLGGLLASGGLGWGSIGVAEVSPDRRDELRRRFPDLEVGESIPPCRTAIIAVKPDGAVAAARAAADAGASRLLSIAAGVRLRDLDDAAPDAAVIRAMPNTPALVGLGSSAIAGGARTDEDDLRWATSILEAVGRVDWLPETMLDAYTGLAGSGPAYVFLVAEALVDAAVAQGFDAPQAAAVVSQLLVGSAALLAQEGDPAALRRAVTSPGGTTAAGLAVLDERGVADAIVAAVDAATARSRELG